MIRSEKGPETEAWAEQEDACRERRTDPARLYPQRAPDNRKLTQDTHERNQAELRCDLAWTPRRVGGPGHSHWKDTGPRLQGLRKERARAVRVVALQPRCPRSCSQGGDAAGPAHCVGEPPPTNNTSARAGACVSLKVVEVVVAGPAVESEDTSPVVQTSVDDACEEPLCPR